MRGSGLRKSPPSQRPVAKTWCRGLLVLCVSLGLMAIAGAMATSSRVHQPEPTARTGLASGGGNLIPLY